MIIYILLGFSVALNLALIYGAWNLLKKTEAIEDLMITTIFDAKEHIYNALLIMKDADLKGAFEAEDEVGSAFKEIKEAIDTLNEKF